MYMCGYVCVLCICVCVCCVSACVCVVYLRVCCVSACVCVVYLRVCVLCICVCVLCICVCVCVVYLRVCVVYLRVCVGVCVMDNFTIITSSGNTVLVHGGSGRDLTLLATSLAQVLLDPHCRTITGYVAIVQAVTYGQDACDFHTVCYFHEMELL